MLRGFTGGAYFDDGFSVTVLPHCVYIVFLSLIIAIVSKLDKQTYFSGLNVKCTILYLTYTLNEI